MRICGLDEVGRGPLAGPLVAAGVILNPKSEILSSKIKLNDSKKLNLKQREACYRDILASGAEVRIEIISARQINNRGVGWANKEIFRRLIGKIEADKYIVDGNLKIRVKGKIGKIKSIIKADNTRKCVMAAAIVAKVTRDEIMRQLHTKYPGYGWERNAGYGTRRHIMAIKEMGMVRYHRTVFVTTALRRINDTGHG